MGRSRPAWGIVAVIVCLAGAGCGTRVQESSPLVRATPGGPNAPAASSEVAPASGPETSGARELSDESETGAGAVRRSPTNRTPETTAQTVLPDSAGRSGGGGSTGSRTGVQPAEPPVAPGPSVVSPGRSTARIGLVGTMSGPIGASFRPISIGVQAWVRSVNARQGGVNGHPVELRTADDGGDPARHRSLVQMMVEKDKVIALVGNPEAVSGASSVDYLTSKRVPVIGSDAANDYFYESPTYFPQMVHGTQVIIATFAAAGQYAVRTGMRKMGLVACQEVQICRDVYSAFDKYAKEFQLDPVYKAQASLVQPDYTAECLGARNAGVQVLLPLLDPNSVRRLAASCARQGLIPHFHVGSSIQTDGMKTDPTLDGMSVMSNVFPYIQGSTPATAEYQDAVKRYAPEAFGAGGAQGWVAGKLFERAAANLSEPPSSESVLDGLWSVREDTLGGLTLPLTFLRDQPTTPRACWFNMELHDGAWTTPDNFELHCVK